LLLLYGSSATADAQAEDVDPNPPVPSAGQTAVAKLRPGNLTHRHPVLIVRDGTSDLQTSANIK
jgi:hypothetical protein